MRFYGFHSGELLRCGGWYPEADRTPVPWDKLVLTGAFSESKPWEGSCIPSASWLSASGSQPPQRSLQRQQPRFVPAGQSTQMIIGATKETDYHIVTVAHRGQNIFTALMRRKGL